jgi:hypothetical protein
VRAFLARTRASLIGLTVIAVLSLVGTAVANRAIRDNTINTRDIKDNQVNSLDVRDGSLTTRDIRDNQVNTRDLRDGAIRGVDIHDGTVGLAKLSPGAASEAAATTLVDPRSHGQDDDASWALGPAAITEVASSASDPLPTATSGQAWRDIVLDPGAYLVQTSGYASSGGKKGAEGVAARLFFAGKPLADGTGYGLFPVSATQLPTPTSFSTIVLVPAGEASNRHLTERVAAVGEAATFTDDIAITAVNPK